jgi:hypothetical protein
MAAKGKGITSVTPGHNAERWKGTLIFESSSNLTRYFEISKRQSLARKLPSPRKQVTRWDKTFWHQLPHQKY